jgi:hypothetical protein
MCHRVVHAILALVILLAHGRAAWAETVGPTFDAANDTGVTRLFSAVGPITIPHPFGQALGTNGRMCVSCHSPFDGMSLTPAGVRARFDATGGLDPLFTVNDGSNSPTADVSTVEARRRAYSMLLSRAVIRVEMAPPPGAEFIVEAVDDPYGFADRTRLSLFRRPLPSINTAFLTTVMWDGRETFGSGLRFDLEHQATDATVGHAQAAQAPTRDQQAAIVDLETTIFAAQISDQKAGDLTAGGAKGGPEALARQEFFPGINSGPNAFNLFDAWKLVPAVDPVSAARLSIANGQSLFNTRGLGATGLTCTSCHNTPNVGSQSNGLFFETGTARAARRTPDLPLYTLRCVATNTVVQTTDPGRAMVTGRCADIGNFKVPGLRGLAAHPPFFHDGSAATLRDVVIFYNDVFQAGFRSFEIDDLVAFLKAL